MSIWNNFFSSIQIDLNMWLVQENVQAPLFRSPIYNFYHFQRAIYDSKMEPIYQNTKCMHDMEFHIKNVSFPKWIQNWITGHCSQLVSSIQKLYICGRWRWIYSITSKLVFIRTMWFIIVSSNKWDYPLYVGTNTNQDKYDFLLNKEIHFSIIKFSSVMIIFAIKKKSTSYISFHKLMFLVSTYKTTQARMKTHILKQRYNIKYFQLKIIMKL